MSPRATFHLAVSVTVFFTLTAATSPNLHRLRSEHGQAASPEVATEALAAPLPRVSLEQGASRGTSVESIVSSRFVQLHDEQAKKTTTTAPDADCKSDKDCNPPQKCFKSKCKIERDNVDSWWIVSAARGLL
ncbi:unnamed protein product [Vitrella brassicaformis CCMP3155]|uniref:Uncharacterized protein n=1 Tax=Vitrella brassicaformis (strain CCMP3155) TaxID=1169540 RepID=A0A0G4FR03_VITBC|nr:unnamed protein product [Vitrella brassicaformis CCMP3155]|mmetsp:Transcript_10436/g.25252  ORF Transcript_10436/g.25252 Transcript_10436/m.25252 type:complete len:132 (-) Transcript_10436:1053-1448(-)|eukprot:CEM16883.1 unnamed protein product [Vitrella brassicaformis CCMP3155]